MYVSVLIAACRTLRVLNVIALIALKEPEWRSCAREYACRDPLTPVLKRRLHVRVPTVTNDRSHGHAMVSHVSVSDGNVIKRDHSRGQSTCAYRSAWNTRACVLERAHSVCSPQSRTWLAALRESITKHSVVRSKVYRISSTCSSARTVNIFEM